MDDAIGIGLRRPDVVVDRAREGLAGGIELKDGDDFPGLRFFDQIVVLEAPGGSHVRAEAAARVTSVATRPGTNVEDANLQDIAGFGAFYDHRAGQQVHADPLARAEPEWAICRACAAARHRLVLPGPMKHALGAGVAGHHALAVVVRMMGQRLDGGPIAGP
jgi:hypothetical protein